MEEQRCLIHGRRDGRPFAGLKEAGGEDYVRDGGWYVKRWVVDQYGSIENAPPDVVEQNRMRMRGNQVLSHADGGVYGKTRYLPPDLLDKARMLVGVGPYDSPVNDFIDDPYLEFTMREKYGDTAVDEAILAVEQMSDGSFR